MFSFSVASVDLKHRFSKERKETNSKAMPCYQRPVMVPSDWLVGMVLPCYQRPGMGFFLNLFKGKSIFSHFT